MFNESVGKILKSKDFKNVSGNFLYLFLLNIANFILPVITFPYLVSRLGVDKFGLLAFVSSIISYFLILTDYAFNLSATRQISMHRSRPSKLNQIVSSVYTIKFFLVLLSILILSTLVMTVPKFEEYKWIYFFTFGTVIGQSIFPVWFFQGIEKMKFISILNILSKVIFTACVFIFVKKSEDFFLVPIFNSLGYIAAGGISLWMLFFRCGIRLKKVYSTTVFFYVKDGWHLFVSNISVTLYTTAVTTVLGFFSSNTVVGYYSIAEKIIQIIRGLIAPVSQTLFPYLVSMANKEPAKILQINRKLLLYGSFVFIPICLVIYIFSPLILSLLFSNVSHETVTVLRIFSPIPYLIFLATVFALFTMIVFDRNKAYSRIIVSAGIINILMSFILIPMFFHIGAAVCVLLIELYVTFRYIWYTQKNGLALINRL